MRRCWICLLVLLTAASPLWAPAPPAPTITFVGDLMVAGKVGRLARQQGSDCLLARVAPLLRADALTVGNLECAVAASGRRQDKRYTFRARPDLLPGLRRSGLEAVSLANNHTLDYGTAGLLATLRHLQEAGLGAVGAGANQAQAFRPLLVNAGGRRLALLAASRVLPTTRWRAGPRRPGLAQAYEPALLLAAIKAARPQADLVAVYLHWGQEGALSPTAGQRRLARQCIGAGADLVVGCHPHVLQGFEYYRGKLVAYSLGNFLFSSTDRTSVLLQCTLQDGRLQARLVPCLLRGFRPRPLVEEAARRHLLAALEQRSFGVRISPDGGISPRP